MLRAPFSENSEALLESLRTHQPPDRGASAAAIAAALSEEEGGAEADFPPKIVFITSEYSDSCEGGSLQELEDLVRASGRDLTVVALGDVAPLQGLVEAGGSGSPWLSGPIHHPQGMDTSFPGSAQWRNADSSDGTGKPLAKSMK